MPPLLTFGEVVGLFKFWNLGGLGYARDLRAVGKLTSVTEWTNGPRARFASSAVLELYPVKEI
jgi:hypothetical protein